MATLAADALVTLADFKAYIGSASASGSDAEARAILAVNSASSRIAHETERVLICPGVASPYTDYHPGRWSCTRLDARAEIYPSQWPLVSITSLHEDETRAYGASTELVLGTGYALLAPSGERPSLVRIEAGDRIPWAWAYRAVRHVYVAGYQPPGGTAISGAVPVPSDLAAICLELAARIWQRNERKAWDVQSFSDAAGNWTRFGRLIDQEMRATLDAYTKHLLVETAECAA